MMKNKVKTLKLLTVFATVTLLLFLPDVIDYVKGILSHQFFEATFVIKYDWNLQHIPFYQEFYRLIDSGKIAWSWNQLLGINFYASKAYYLLGDPYAWIGYIFYHVITLSVSNCLFITTMMKVFVSGCSMYLYLHLFCKENKTAFLFSVLYMTSGWVSIFIEQPVFLSFYSIAPLLLYGVELIFEKKNYIPFVIASAFLLCINYYFTWMICLFLLVYWFVRYWQVNGALFSKNFWLYSFKIFFAFLLGVLISSIVWFPSLKHMFLSSRLVSGDHVTYNFWEIFDAISIIKSFFIPVFKFDETIYRSIWYYFYQIGIYCGCIQMLLLPQFFASCSISRKEKAGFGILLGLLLFTLLSPQFSKLFHFTYSLRYTMLIIIALLLINVHVFDNLNEVNRKVLTISGIAVLSVFVMVGIVFPIYLNKTSSLEFLLNVLILAFLGVYFVLLYFVQRKKIRKLISFLMLVEAIAMGILPIQSQKEDVSNVNYLMTNDSYQEAYDAIKAIDSTFGRVYIDGMGFNEGAYLDIPTTSTYDSCYQYTIHDFLSYMREYPDVDWAFSISGEEMFDLLDVKYVITDQGMGEVYYQYFCEQLDIPLSSNLAIYRVNNQTAFGKSFQSFMKKSDFDFEAAQEDKYYLHEITDMLSSTLIVPDVMYDELTKNYQSSEFLRIEPVQFSNNHLEFIINSQTDTVVLLSMAYDPGWVAYSDTDIFDLFSVQGGLCAIELPAGNYTLSMDYSVPGLSTGKILSGLGIVCLLIYVCKKYKEKNYDESI